MGIPNYRGSSSPETLSMNGKTFVQVYNDTGGAISNGAIKVVGLKLITGIGVINALIAPATEVTDANVVGIVNNAPYGKSTIPDAEYGWVQTYGLYGSDAENFGVSTSGTVNANDQLEVLNGGTAFIDAGVNGGVVYEAESVAIAVENVTTNVWSVFLIGKQSAIQAA